MPLFHSQHPFTAAAPLFQRGCRYSIHPQCLAPCVFHPRAAAMATAIQEQLVATRKMLTQLQGTEHFETLSASQCHVVERLVQSSKLTVPELASVLEEVNTTGFAEVHRQHLLGVVGRKSVPASVVVTAADQKYQNWESFKSYLPQRVWSQVSNDEGPTALFTFLRDLGLRLPSEGTHQVASVILLVSTEGNEKALAMSACAKNEFLKASKRWWKAVSNNGPPPLEMTSKPGIVFKRSFTASESSR